MCVCPYIHACIAFQMCFWSLRTHETKKWDIWNPAIIYRYSVCTIPISIGKVFCLCVSHTCVGVSATRIARYMLIFQTFYHSWLMFFSEISPICREIYIYFFAVCIAAFPGRLARWIAFVWHTFKRARHLNFVKQQVLSCFTMFLTLYSCFHLFTHRLSPPTTHSGDSEWFW